MYKKGGCVKWGIKNGSLAFDEDYEFHIISGEVKLKKILFSSITKIEYNISNFDTS